MRPLPPHPAAGQAALKTGAGSLRVMKLQASQSHAGARAFLHLAAGARSGGRHADVRPRKFMLYL